MLILESVNKAEKFVTEQRRLGNDVYCDNYDIVFFRPSEKGIYDAKFGAFRDGRYGFLNRFPVTTKGTWEIDSRNVVRRRSAHA